MHYEVPPPPGGLRGHPSRPRLPVTERLAAGVLSLPIGPHVEAVAVDHVIDVVRSATELAQAA